MLYMYGDAMLNECLKTYFAKYSFKNTELKDFVNELAIAAKKTGVVSNEKEMIDWSATWLQSAGAAEIQLLVNDRVCRPNNNGKIESFKV